MAVNETSPSDRSDLSVSISILDILRCPKCKGKLTRVGGYLECSCGGRYPIEDGIPILINEQNSVFSIADYEGHGATYFRPRSKAKELIDRILPDIGSNHHTKENYRKFADLVTKGGKAKVLVVGGGILGAGMQEIIGNPEIEFIESDVAFGPRTQIICDGHDLPFEDESLNGIIVQGVLEHVADPHRCAEEFHRVLRADGIVYAETAFMQQVHGAEFDFTRFTEMGHRRLFRRFTELASGAVCGPGMALAWSWQHFLLSFTTNRRARQMIRVTVRLTAFWWKYFDALLIDKPGGLDAAAGFYFMGRKSNTTIPDRELVKNYRGAV